MDRTSSPLNVTCPEVGSIRRRMERPIGGLAAPQFSHQSQRLAVFDGEAHLVHGLHLRHGPLKKAAAHGEILYQVFHDQQV